MSGTGRTCAACAADPAPERLIGVRGRGLRHRERAAEDRVGAEPRLVDRSVELDQHPVDGPLVARVGTGERRADHLDDVRDRPEDTLPEIRVGVAVPQLDCLEAAGRRTRRHRRPPGGARLEGDVDLDRRIPPRVEDLPCAKRGDPAAHPGSPSFARS